MTSDELKAGRLQKGLTQVKAAARLGLSQPYLSQLERGRRPVTAQVASAAAKLFRLPPTALPLPGEQPRAVSADKLVRELAALGYPGYKHVSRTVAVNPALVVLQVLSEDNVDARVTAALPWVLLRYPDLDWNWLLTQVKLRNLQNRLGFLVSVARELANRASEPSVAAARLAEVVRELEQARLVAETTLGRESMPVAEKNWLRTNRPQQAKDWNVLTSLTAEQLQHAL